MNVLNVFFYFTNLFLEYAVSFLYFNYHIVINFGQHIYLCNILEHTYIRMDNINAVFKKYIRPNPNPSALSMAMVGLSTLMLVYFVAYKEEPVDSPPSLQEESPPSLQEESQSRLQEGSQSRLQEGSQSRLEEGSQSSLSQQTTVGGHSHGAAGTRGKRRNKKTKRRKL